MRKTVYPRFTRRWVESGGIKVASMVCQAVINRMQSCLSCSLCVFALNTNQQTTSAKERAATRYQERRVMKARRMKAHRVMKAPFVGHASGHQQYLHAAPTPHIASPPPSVLQWSILLHNVVFHFVSASRNTNVRQAPPPAPPFTTPLQPPGGHTDKVETRFETSL